MMKANAWGYGGENKDNEGEAVKVKWAANGGSAGFISNWVAKW